LAAIGAAPEPQPASVAEPPVQASAEAQEGAEAAAAPRDAAQATAASAAAQGASVAVPRPTGRDTLRTVQAVLAAWDGAPDVEHVSLTAAIEQLRQALAKPATASCASGPRRPRTATKQAAVLALLRRPEGASGPAIAAATGWAPHTVRGFLAALKQRGVAVTVHERVRQVGPSKAGAKGSYTIYRIAEAG
jgi:hypothetical protein